MVTYKTTKQNLDFTLRSGIQDDVPALVDLHRLVSEDPAALIREQVEITSSYMEAVVSRCENNGLMLVAFQGDQLIGEIHAYTPDLFAFSHLLSYLTIVVRPSHQGKGVGRALFEAFLQDVETDFEHILRVELYTREHIARNVAFYTSLGFQNEGRQENKIRLKDGTFHTPIHMVWFNPNYKSK